MPAAADDESLRMSRSETLAGADATLEGETLVLTLRGEWKMTGARPAWESVLGAAVGTGADTGQVKSPGQLASHYAPSIPVRLNVTHFEEGEALLAFGSPVPEGAETTLNLSENGNLTEAAANLFGYLRALDNGYHKAIAVMPIPNEGVGEAINDRLKRAAVR